jgi:hypothetical protein
MNRIDPEFARHADLIAILEPLARHFFGEPNRAMSSNTELRFGSHGSLSVDLVKGVWHDHEMGKGGGVLDLIEGQTGRQGADRFRWLEDNGFLNRPTKPRIVKTYDYQDEKGVLLFQVVRFEPKDFRQRRPDPVKRGEWIWSVEGVRQAPYRLPDVMEPIALGKPIFLPEGEKDVDRLWALGVPATCNAGGAGKWRPELSAFFSGADVVVIPDNDPQKRNPRTGEPQFHPDGRPVLPGQDHAQAVAKALAPAAARVRLLDLKQFWPDMPLKGDVSDWLDHGGGSAEALYALVERLPDWSPPAPPPVGSPWRWHGDAHDQPLKEWLVDKTLPKVGKGLLSGQWGTLKTFVAIDLARAVVTKTTFAGRPVKRQGGVLLVATEGQDEFPLRVDGIAQALTFAADAKTFGPDRLPFAWAGECPRLAADDACDRLLTMIADGTRQMQARFDLPVALIIVDAMTSAAGFRDADDAAETQRVMDVLDKVARKTEAFVLVVDHFGKDVTTGTRNSSVKEDAVDAVLATLADRSLAGALSHTRLAFRKVRGGLAGQEIAYSARVVEILEKDHVVTTLVVEWAEAPAVVNATPKKGLSTSMAIFKRALDYALADSGKRIHPFLNGPEVLAVDRTAVRHEFLKIYPADAPKAKAKAFERCEIKAVADGLMTSRQIEHEGLSRTFFWSTSGP